CVGQWPQCQPGPALDQRGPASEYRSGDLARVPASEVANRQRHRSIGSMSHHPYRDFPDLWPRRDRMAGRAGSAVHRAVARVAAMIRIDEIWLATEPLDMRAGPDKALARVVQV